MKERKAWDQHPRRRSRGERFRPTETTGAAVWMLCLTFLVSNWYKICLALLLGSSLPAATGSAVGR